MTILNTVVCCRTRTFFVGGLVVAGMILSLGHSQADPHCMIIGCENGIAPFTADANNVCGPGVAVAYFCPTSTGGRKLCHCPPADVPDDTDTDVDEGTNTRNNNSTDDRTGEQPDADPQ